MTARHAHSRAKGMEVAMSDKKVMSLMRAVDAAAACLVEGQPVSINDIASTAQCSTATIYAAFSNKEQLVQAAVDRCNTLHALPLAPAPNPDTVFFDLVDFLVQRIDFLSSPHLRTYIQLRVDFSSAFEYLSSHVSNKDPLPHTVPLVAMAIEQGYLIQADPVDLGYGLLSAISYEPIMLNIWRRQRSDPAAQLPTAMRPFLTAAGKEELSVTLAKLGLSEPDRAARASANEPPALVGMHRRSKPPVEHPPYIAPLGIPARPTERRSRRPGVRF